MAHNSTTINGVKVWFQKDSPRGDRFNVHAYSERDWDYHEIGFVIRNHDRTWSPGGSLVRHRTRAEAAASMVAEWERNQKGCDA